MQQGRSFMPCHACCTWNSEAAPTKSLPFNLLVIQKHLPGGPLGEDRGSVPRPAAQPPRVCGHCHWSRGAGRRGAGAQASTGVNSMCSRPFEARMGGMGLSWLAGDDWGSGAGRFCSGQGGTAIGADGLGGVELARRWVVVGRWACCAVWMCGCQGWLCGGEGLKVACRKPLRFRLVPRLNLFAGASTWWA